MKRVKIKNPRGLGLAAVMHQPKTESKVPLVILLHGFTGWREEEHIVSLAELLASKGIGAIRFDASGSGESEGTFEKDYRMSNYLKDIEVIYAYVKKQPWVDAERIGVWGHSMGGQLAAWFASQHSGLKALCSSQGSIGIANIPRYAKSRADWQRTGYKIFESKHFGKIKLPYEFYDDRDGYDVLPLLPKLKIPKLFIAGRQDGLVPVETVKKAFAAAAEPKAYYEHPEADHHYKKHPKILETINQKTLVFFQNHL